MSNPEDWDTGYIKELKKHYANDIINYMFREGVKGTKFSRLYSLLSLIQIFDSKDEERYVELKKIVAKARELGYDGTDPAIEYGLNSSFEAGLVEVIKDKQEYRLNPRFREWVIKQKNDIQTTLKTFIAKR